MGVSLSNSRLLADIRLRPSETAIFADVTSELEKLEQGHAVGDLTHRFILREAITEFRNTLAEVLFVWSCQNPLPSNDCLKVSDCCSRFSSVINLRVKACIGVTVQFT